MFARIHHALPNPVRFCLRLLATAGDHWLKSDAFTHAAALAFYTVFSIAPVIIVVVAVVGLVLGESAAQGELMAQLEGVLGPQAAEVVQAAVINSQIEHSGIWPTLIGLSAIVVGATTVFVQIQWSLNVIWDVVPKPSRSSIWLFVRARMLSLAIVLAVGFVLLVSLLVSVAARVAIAFAEQWLPIPGWALVGLEIVLSLAVVTLLFAAMFKILPDVILSWRDVLAGALVTALLFTIGRSLIALYLGYTATASTYGAAGSMALLLLWVYYSSLILLYGAAVTRAYREARSLPIQPRNTAICVQRELIENVADSSRDRS